MTKRNADAKKGDPDTLVLGLGVSVSSETSFGNAVSNTIMLATTAACSFRNQSKVVDPHFALVTPKRWHNRRDNDILCVFFLQQSLLLLD